MNLVSKLEDISVVQHGTFTLKSGETSNIYCDFRKCISYPKIMKEICYYLGRDMDYDNKVIAGVPHGATPYACGISNAYDVPMVLIRKQPKEHGLGKMIEGDLKDREIILVEDVITSGGSVLETIEKVQNSGGTVCQVLCVLDRQAGGVQRIINEGFPVKSLFQLSDLTHQHANDPVQENDLVMAVRELIKTKGSNIIFSPDMENVEELIYKLDLVGPYILGVKLHTDIFPPDHVPGLVEHVLRLKEKHNLLVIEDRKFSDIGSIAQKQLVQIKGWADIVTTHGIVGESMLQALDELAIGLLPIHSLSTSDNLIDTTYSCHVIDMAKRCKNVIGFITQEHVLDGYLNFSPGVNIHDTGDTMGQSYRTPEVMKDNRTDVFIVGRGIYNSDDVVESAKMYRDRCLI